MALRRPIETLAIDCRGLPPGGGSGSLPPQQQLGVVLALQVLVDEVGQQLLEHAGGVLHLALQRRHDERGHVAAVAHGEGALGLQRADEGEQEVLFGEQLAEQRQGLLHVGLHLGGLRREREIER